ncbi:MAG: rhodanese-like domain-containing protein [Verrucomicrobiota bacterium]
MSIAIISPLVLKDRMAANAGLKLIDVRTPPEFRAVHVIGAMNLPLDQVSKEAFENVAGDAEEVILICKSGARSGKAGEQLEKLGVEGLSSVEGGTDRCVEEGLSVNRGESVISLDRQVRIMAGSIVLVGSVLGLLVHPGFFALPIFIGAGFVFSGLTDTCGMGVMLSKMPWNRQ